MERYPTKIIENFMEGGASRYQAWKWGNHEGV
jgi:hypothetical protein